MIVCKEYKPGYTKEVDGITKYYVFVELKTGAVPSVLPANAVGIENFPQSFPLEDVVFAAGSTLYCADTQKLYMTDETGTWKEQ